MQTRSLAERLRAKAEKPNLPAFEQVIEVKVEVSAIYEKLLASFPEDYKHRENLAHAIIGSTKDNSGIGHIYNALNGYSNAIDFQVHETVMCDQKEKNEWYDSNRYNEDGSEYANVVPEVAQLPKWKMTKKEIGVCVIVAIDLYRDNKLLVEFIGQNEYNNDKPAGNMRKWVNHRSCTKWGEPENVGA